MTTHKPKLEAKHVFYVPSQRNPNDDACFVKEYEHRSDGTMVPNLRMIKNYQREWYITKEGFRKHKDKKESEDINRLTKRTSNTRMMPKLIAQALQLPTNNLNMRMLARSQYLYGTDITPETLIKKKYQTTWPDAISASSVAVLDLETDVGDGRRDIYGFGDIISGSLTMKNRAFLVYTKKFLAANSDGALQEAFEKYLGKYKKDRNIELETLQVENDTQVVIELLKRAHAWGPDFVSIWNINFDLPKMIRTLERDGIDPARHFSDPSVPKEFQYCNYIEGAPNRVTDDGKVMNFGFHERWHSLIAPAKFQWVCSMSSFAFIRKHEGNLPSYSLDAILHMVLGERKLNFSMADGLKKIAWHEFMQSKFKIEYLIYNIFDCIGVELLDEKTQDISLTLPELIGASPLRIFSSTPKQLAEDLHFFLLERGRVICSVSNQMADELDSLVIGIDDWILTLATHLVEVNGLKCIEDVEGLQTLIRLYVADLDIRSAYPWGEIVMNASKATTVLELVSIEGVSEKERRRIGVNISGGTTNAINYCETVHKHPGLQAFYEEYLKHVA